LRVDGAATFGGGNTNGLLTAGVLEIRGNFSEPDFFDGAFSDSSVFAASGNHTTVFSGSGVQSIFFQDPSSALSRFRHLTLSSSTGASFTSSTVATGSVTVSGGAVTSAAGMNITIGASLLDSVGGRWQV